MKNKIIYIILIFMVLSLSVFYVRENNKNKELEKRNNELANMIRYENYDPLELLPCPLCEEEVEIYTIKNKYYVKCANCNYETTAFSEIQDVINMWNSFER